MDSDKIVNFLFEIASLRRLIRSHHQFIATANDNISDHSFRVAIIGMILAKLENGDENKVLKMCLFHDLTEARTGDANSINQRYVKQREEQALTDQMADLPFSKEIKDILAEREKGQSREAIITRDADKIDQMILQQEYFYKDIINGKRWQKYTEKNLLTVSAKKIAHKIKTANPFTWLYQALDKK